MARQEETADRRFGVTLPRLATVLAVLALLLSAARIPPRRRWSRSCRMASCHRGLGEHDAMGP